MSIVNTTLGTIDTGQLGAVDMHDHVILDTSNNPLISEDFHHIETGEIAAELQNWKDAGGGVIVDSSPIGAGRNIDLLIKTSQDANLALIPASGFHKRSYYQDSHWVFSEPEERIHQILFAECSRGILLDERDPLTSNRSEIKAGILKVGVDASGIKPWLAKIIAATAKTMDMIDVNLMIHTEPKVPFPQLLKILEENHIPPNRTIICHMGKSLDIELHQSLAQEGYYLEFDEMVRRSPPLPDLAQAILQLIELGYGHLILFAGDLARKSYWACYGGTPGLPYLKSGLTQDLLALGFTAEILDEIWVKNPRNFFNRR